MAVPPPQSCLICGLPCQQGIRMALRNRIMSLWRLLFPPDSRWTLLRLTAPPTWMSMVTTLHPVPCKDRMAEKPALTHLRAQATSQTGKLLRGKRLSLTHSKMHFTPLRCQTLRLRQTPQQHRQLDLAKIRAGRFGWQQGTSDGLRAG